MGTNGQRRSGPGREWWTVALVLTVSVLVGMVLLPRLGPGASGLVGKPAPDFTLPVIHGAQRGQMLRLTELRGRAVVLDFWASWCTFCGEQVPAMERVSRRHGDGVVVVLGVATNDEFAKASRFLASRNVTYASVFDGDSRVADAYGVRQLPTMVVIDPAGRVTAVRHRVVRERELEELVREAGSS